MSRTVPTQPNNALTPSFATVSSSAGFQAGDLVYLKDNAFNPIPDNAVSSATFNINSSVALGECPTSSIIQSLVARDGGASGHANQIARLTNNNIVVVYVDQQSSDAYFRILNENLVEQVVQTQVSSNNVSTGWVGVAALSGGGFVVAFVSGGVLNYAVYNNSGVIQGSLVNDATVSSIGFFDIKPLPLSGGFAICYNSSNVNYQLRYYNSAGTPTSSWVSPGNSGNSNYWPVICPRSDDTAVVFGATQAAGPAYSLNHWFISAVGAVSGTGTAIGVTNNILNGGYHATTLSTNDVVVVYSPEPATQSAFRRTVSSSNVLGSATNILGSSITIYGVWIATLPSDNVLILGANTTGNTNSTSYQIQTSGGATVLGVQAYNGMLFGSETYWSHASFAVTPNFVTITFPTSYTRPAAFTSAFQVSLTAPYDRRVFTPVTVQTGTATANASGYARSNSTPNGAAFFASTTGSISTSSVASTGTTYVLSPRTVTTSACWGLDGVVLPTGNFVLAFVLSNLSAVQFTVYSPVGTVINTYTLPVTPTGPYVRACVLTSGRLVITCVTAASVLTHYIYSSTFNLETTCTTTSVFTETSPGNAASGFSTAGLSDGRFIVGYRQTGTSTAYYQIFESNGTSVTVAQIDSLANGSNVTVAATQNGGAMASYNNNSTAVYSSYIYRTAGGGYAVTTVTSSTPTSTGAYGNSMKTTVTPSGTFVSVAFDSGSGKRLYFIGPGSTRSAAPGSFGSSTAFPDVAATSLSTGEIVTFAVNGAGVTSVTVSVYPPALWSAGGGSPGSINVLSSNTITLPVAAGSTSNLGPQATILGLYGSRCVIAYLATGNIPYYGIIDTASSTYTANTTAGVTPSAPSFTPSQSNGYYLAGVSASACSAGGVGTVQTSGTATLNANYPAATASQAFDFTSPSVKTGVRGTIAGRNMIIEG